MLRVALKGMWARKLRLLLTSIAVVLGVAFVSGAFLLTDSLRSSFADLFDSATEGLAVEVRTDEYRDLNEALQSGTVAPGAIAIDLSEVGVTPEVLETVRDIDGVDIAAGSIFEIGAQPLDRDGDPIGSTGSPTFLANWDPAAEEANPIELLDGRAPGEGEVMLDTNSAKEGKFELGDDVRILIQGGRVTETFELVGIVQFGGSASSFFGAISVFETPTAQRLVGAGENFSAVDATSDGTVSDGVLKQRVAHALDDDYDVVTGSELTSELSESVDTGFLSLLQNFILAFAAIAVFVGAFTIFNTFTILVGQRTREFGLLRALGASRKQVLGIVTLEAVFLGLLASTLGMFAGYGVASVLRAAISAADIDLPTGSFPLEQRTIIASYAVGVLVTLIACLLPAWRASRLSPLEALRVSSASSGRGWKTPAFGAVLMLAGIVAVVRGFSIAESASSTTVLTTIGVGCGIAVVGVALVSRLIIAPVTRLLAPGLAWGTAGQLATRNVLRNRSRSATTASALMIGLAIASLALVFSSSLGKTIDDEITRTVGSDITIYNRLAQSSSAVVGDGVIEEIRGIEGVESVTSQQYGGFQFGDEYDASDKDLQLVSGFEPEAIGPDGALRLDIVEGSVDPGDGLLVAEEQAEERDLSVGDDVDIAVSTGDTATLRVEGIYATSQFAGGWLMADTTFEGIFPEQLHAASFVFVDVDDGVKPRTVVQRIEDGLGDDAKLLEVQDTEQLRDQVSDQLAPIIGIVLALLGLSLIIALFGIANTLALNVFERTREIGLLRAVGGTRPQLRRIIRVEAVLVALFGAVVGVLVGVAAGYALVSALESDGFVFALSPLPLIGVLVAGFVAGLLASILPARRAGRMDVLRAISTE